MRRSGSRTPRLGPSRSASARPRRPAARARGSAPSCVGVRIVGSSGARPGSGGRPRPRSTGRGGAVRSARAVIKRTLVSFYDDQMTHHAAALTYYSLMSLFPGDVAGAVLARAPRPIPKHLQRDHRLPARRRPALGPRAVGQLAARGPPAQGNGGDGVGDECPAHPLRHHWSARGSTACSERRFRARCRRS